MIPRLDDGHRFTVNTPLTDEIWWFRLGWAPPILQNVFLVDDGELTLVDAGLPWDDRRLRSFVREAGYEISEIDRVLVTHYDLDHMGAIGRLRPELDAPVYMGARDLEMLDGKRSPPLIHHKGAFHRVTRHLFSLPSDLDAHPVEDGDEIGGFLAFHTPGHNPGHTAYVHEKLEAAFLGDLVWEENGELTTPVLLDSYDMDELADSVRRLAERAPHFEVACMGHGRPIRESGRLALNQLAASV